MKLQYILCLSLLAIVFADEWTPKSPMLTARSDFTATTVGGSIFIVGGCATNQVCPAGVAYCFCEGLTNKTEAYNPSEDSWSTLADMPRLRYRHAAAAVGTKIYLIGGRDLLDTIIQEIDVYDIPSNTWSTVNSIYTWTNATSDLTVTTIGTKIYAVGGYDQNYISMATTWVLDTALPLPKWTSTQVPRMHLGRGDACAVTINGKIYVYGGFSDANFCAALSELEVYDPETNTWTEAEPLHNPRGDSSCAVQHGKFHAIGGEVKDSETNCSQYSQAVSHVEYYDPVTGVWSDETAFPVVRFRFSAAAWGDNFYVFGGQSALVGEEYPVTNTVFAIHDTTPPDVGSAGSLVSSVMMIALLLCVVMF